MLECIAALLADDSGSIIPFLPNCCGFLFPLLPPCQMAGGFLSSFQVGILTGKYLN